ncbi:hypothetical protein BH789_gp068 [Gordonia phage GMA6]|uniref:Uncharacterized protein n=1 Tax=Gordonia phage GMA6 TaxID=1647285 RepID=A0A0K0NL71_9CAUD|nr:hypothetical protein BH789_gp068 [Gordonia phage GMA6]AKL88349.1 hypothetical protein GMA6_68 [Gordonia phage GMA6]
MDFNPLNGSNGTGRGGEEYIVRSYAEILESNGLSTCPFNITACRLSVMACEHLDASLGNDFNFQVLYSETIDAPVLYVGVHDSEGGFSPMLMVMTSEFIGRLRLYCGGPDCNHEACEAMPEALKEQVHKQTVKALRDEEPEVDTTDFAPIVDSIADELPSFEDLAKYYQLGDEGETKGG